MEFRSIYISHPAQLSVRQNQLVIRQEQEVTVPMEDITSLLIESQSVSLSTAAIQSLSSAGVTVYFCDEKHMPAALVLPMNQHSRQLRLLNRQIALTSAAKNRIWKQVVSCKIANQARCLSLLSKREAEDLKYMAGIVRSGDPDNWEAQAAATYFPALFGHGFTRGDACLTNAMLNYGYAIVRGAVARNLVMHGLEPCLGIFHHSELNQFNLADDLMEPFRPLVDLFTVRYADDSDNLTPRQKQQLFNLTNYVMLQDGRRYRMITAIGRMVESYSRILQGSGAALSLPELLPLESYRYE